MPAGRQGEVYGNSMEAASDNKDTYRQTDRHTDIQIGRHGDRGRERLFHAVRPSVARTVFHAIELRAGLGRRRFRLANRYARHVVMYMLLRRDR